MLEIHKSVDGKLKRLDRPVSGAWINLEMPAHEELERARKFVNIPDDVISSLKDLDELSRTEEYDDFILIIFRMAYKSEKEGKVEYTTIPFGILIYANYLVTISFFENETISSFKSNGVHTSKKIRATLKLMLQASKTYLRYLKEISRKNQAIQKALEKSLKNEELTQLLTLENSLVFFSTSLRSNSILIEKLTNRNVFNQFEEDRDLLEDVMIENKQALEVTKIYSDILSGTMNAFASIISNNLNIVMKTLTSVTILLMIPTLIASIYGMNIPVPFEDSPDAFLIVILISFLIGLIGVILFRQRDFL